MSYDGSIRINTEISTDEANSQMMSLENRIEKTADKITGLKSKMDEMRNVKVPTKEYEEVSRQIEQATLKLAKLTDKEREYQSQGMTGGSKWDKLQTNIDEVRLELVYANGELDDLVATGKAFTLGTDSAQFKKLSSQLQVAEGDMKVLVKKHDELTEKQKKATNGAKKIGKAYKEAGKSGSNGLEKIARGLRKLALLSIGVQSIGALFNKVRNSLGENFKSLYDYSSSYKAVMDQFTSATSALKNSIAGAFAPVIEAVLPYLTKLVEYVTNATNSMSRFFAILTGKKSYTIGVSSVEKTASDVSSIGDNADNAKQSVKELKGELASFDEMNVLNLDKDNGSDSSGNKTNKSGSSSGSPTTAFKEIALDGYENLDWEELGKSLNEKLLNLLKGIDWEKIYQGAKDFGKGLAEFLNGLISPELFYEVGKTIASALNTAIYFALSFAQNFDFANLGKSIASAINGFFENFDWKALADAINAWVDGLETMLYEAIKNINWKAVFKGLYTFLSNLELDTVAVIVGAIAIKKIGGIKGLAKLLKAGLSEALASAFPAGIGATLAQVMTVDIGTLIGAGTIAEIGLALGATLIGGVVAGWAGFNLGKWLGEKIAEAVGDAESAEYYKNFHWFGDGGLFPTIGEEWGYFTEDIKKKFEDLGKNISTWMGNIKNAYHLQWTEMKNNAISTVLSTTLDLNSKYIDLKNKLDERMTQIKSSLNTSWITIKSASETVVTNMKNNIAGANGIFNSLKSSAISTFSSLYTNLVGGEGWFTKIKNTGETVFTNLKNAVSGKGGIFESLSSNVVGTVRTLLSDLTGTSGLFNQIKSNIDGIFNGTNGLASILKKPFEGLKNSIASLFNPVLAAAETMANGVIKAINGITSSLNKLSFTVPSWVPNYGGKQWGFAIPQVGAVKIPRLATGTVVPANAGEFLAMLGDNKTETEVVSPLSTMKQAMIEALNESGLGNSNVVINAEGDIGSIVRLLNLKLQEEDDRVGRNFGRSVYVG